MKATGVLAGVAAGATAFCIFYSRTAERSGESLAPTPVAGSRQHAEREISRSSFDNRARPNKARAEPVEQMTGPQGSANATDQLAFSALRNRIVDETGLAMQRRNVSVMDCLNGVEIAVDERIRFVIHVSSSPKEATISQWRFAEIVDGQELPASFPACAEAALGGSMRITPDAHVQFPHYEGDISTIYRIEAAPTK